jgi:hypothetical protein
VKPAFTTYLVLLRLASVAFVFSFGTAAWSAVVVGRLAQVGESPGGLGVLFALCEATRLPAALALPFVVARFGVGRVARVGLTALILLPWVAVAHVDAVWMQAAFVLGAAPSMAVYVGVPVVALRVAGAGREGPTLALLGLASGAGGTLGPWGGGWTADVLGTAAGLLLLAIACGVALVGLAGLRAEERVAGAAGGASLSSYTRVLWVALAAALFASAADAASAALVPLELVGLGLSLGHVGFILGAGAAVAGVGLTLLSWLSKRWQWRTVITVGMVVLALGSLAITPTALNAPLLAVGSGTIGLGASVARLGATLALLNQFGRERATHATSMVELALIGGRLVGAPGLGAVADESSTATAFTVITLVALAGIASAVAWRTWWRSPVGSRESSGQRPAADATASG